MNSDSELTRTKKGRLSVDKANIDILLSYGTTPPKCKEFLRALLLYKSDQKRLNTYVAGLRKHICPDGRVRSTYLLHGTETSRRSSKEPNRQNDPTDAEVKRIYISMPDYVFVINDYSNLEVRVAAAMSKDKNLIRAFKDGLDVHSYITSMAYEVEYDEIVAALADPKKYPREYSTFKGMRDRCKAALFALLYGGGPNRIAESAGISLDKAIELKDRILGRFKRLENMFRQFQDFALEYGRAENAFGRWRPLYGASSTDPQVQSEAIRQGLNTPIQGTAADITLTAARKLDRYVEKNQIRVNLVQEVHDSLVTESHFECLHQIMVASREIMEAVEIPGNNAVPLVVDQIIGCHLGSKLKASPEVLEMARIRPQKLYRQLHEDLNHPVTYYEAA
jgi:DNA polymerase-1